MSEEKVLVSYEMNEVQAEAVKVGNLRFRPTSSINGEAGKSGAEMQKAFDAYPDKLRETFNTFVRAMMSSIMRESKADGTYTIGEGSALAGITLTDGEHERTVAELLYTLAFGSLLENFPNFKITYENISDYIDPYTITADYIDGGAITGDKIPPKSVPGDRLEDGSVGPVQIAKGAITGEKLADDAAVRPVKGKINVLYGINSRGEQATFGFNPSHGTNTIPMRDGNGRFECGNPATGKQVTNKEYVDDLISALRGEAYAALAAANAAMELASGRAPTVVLNTKEDMEEWISEHSDILPGTHFVFREQGIPEYWWDGEQAIEHESRNNGYALQADVESGLSEVLTALEEIGELDETEAILQSTLDTINAVLKE